MTVAARAWRAGSKTIELERPVVVGIVNVTPDSFSDGGRAFSAESAVAHALRLAADGADVLDIGGESTRPGALPVSPEEELRRTLPVIEEIRAELPEVALSVDTVKSEVAREALAAGVDIVNDVSGFRLDSRMAETCARAECGVVLMHSRGSVAEMASYEQAAYESGVTETVVRELLERVRAATAAGIGQEAIVLDPGFGFAKRTEHSLALLYELPRIVELGYPLLVGLSRKRVIGELSGVTEAAERDAATAAANMYALRQGARLFRVHDVRLARQTLDVFWKLLEGSGNGVAR